jgi:hypothetical protein
MKTVDVVDGHVIWTRIPYESVRKLVKSGLEAEALQVRQGPKADQVIFNVDGETIVADRVLDFEALRSLEWEFPELDGKLL